MWWFRYIPLKLACCAMVFGCVGCTGERPRVNDTAQAEVLSREVARLNQRVTALSVELAAQNARVVQRDASTPVTACRAPVEPRVDEGSVNVELELRSAQRALARVIERLELPPDAKRELLQSMRPVRALDPENPWVAAN